MTANITNLPAVAAALPTRFPAPHVQAIIPTNYAETASLAQAVCRAQLANKFGNDQSRVAAIMLSGMEVGLKPMASLRLFYVTPEGQPALLARGMLAVVQASGLLEHWEDRLEGDGDDRRAVVVCKRRGFPAITRSFGARDAKAAGLSGRQTYSKYNDRMLWNRAVSYALNDTFADLLGGLFDPSELGGPVVDETGQVLLPPVEETQHAVSGGPTGATPKPPLLVNLPDGWEPAQFPRTGKGLKEALEFLAAAVLDGSPVVVPMNMELLDTIAEKMPALAEEVAELRAAAAEALAPKDEADNFVQEFLGEDDTFPGDLPSKAEG